MRSGLAVCDEDEDTLAMSLILFKTALLIHSGFYVEEVDNA